MASLFFIQNKAARAEARAKGERHFHGRPCPNDTRHGGLRYTKTGACVACTREKSLERYHQDIEASRERGRLYHRTNLAYSMWQSAKHRAARKGMVFTLTPDDIVIPETCPVFGTPMETPSIDRFDNSRGYTPDNIRVISLRANIIKSDATADEVEAVLNYMRGDTAKPFEQRNAENDNAVLTMLWWAVAAA